MEIDTKTLIVIMSVIVIIIMIVGYKRGWFSPDTEKNIGEDLVSDILFAGAEAIVLI